MTLREYLARLQGSLQGAESLLGIALLDPADVYIWPSDVSDITETTGQYFAKEGKKVLASPPFFGNIEESLHTREKSVAPLGSFYHGVVEHHDHHLVAFYTSCFHHEPRIFAEALAAREAAHRSRSSSSSSSRAVRTSNSRTKAKQHEGDAFGRGGYHPSPRRCRRVLCSRWGSRCGLRILLPLRGDRSR